MASLHRPVSYLIQSSISKNFSYSFHFTDITLSFTDSSYRVNENNGPAQPVLVLSHAIDCCSTISVWVNIEDDTAKGT